MRPESTEAMKPTKSHTRIDGRTVYPPPSNTPEQTHYEEILRVDREVTQPTLLTLGKMVVPAPTRAEWEAIHGTDDKARRGTGFIQFHRTADVIRIGNDKAKLALLPMVCFSSNIYTDSAIEIIGDTMPSQWWPGLGWGDLNILKEGYWSGRWNGGTPRPCMKSLNNFIRAFGFKDDDRLFMHVFNAHFLIK